MRALRRVALRLPMVPRQAERIVGGQIQLGNSISRLKPCIVVPMKAALIGSITRNPIVATAT